MTRTNLLLFFFMLCFPSPLHAEPLRVAFLTELSGSNAANGQDCQRGVETAKAFFLKDGRVGAREVEVLIGDHAGDAKTGISEFKKMVELHQVVAVSTTRSSVGMPLNPVSLATRTPLLGTVGHPRFLTDNQYAFRMYPSVELEGSVLAESGIKLGINQAAVISTEDEWTLALEKVFLKHFQELGGKVLSGVTVPIDLPDLSSTVSRLKTGDPQSIFVNMTLAQSGFVVKKLREQGYHGQILTNFWGAHQDSIATAGEENMEGAIFAEVNLDRPRFREKLDQLYPGALPTSVTYSCFTGLSFLLSAVKGNENVRGKEEFYADLKKIPFVPLPDENLPMKEREVHFEMAGKTIRNGKPADLK